MLDASQMPEDNADLAKIVIDCDRLPDDDPSSCPVSLDELLRYLVLEVPDGDALTQGDLAFCRTADVAGTHYWIWAFDEPDGEASYATVARSPNGNITLGYEANYYALTPEQYLLGDYHEVF